MSSSTGEDLAAGRVVLGRYEVIGKLAQGGMAEVYLARQQGPAGYQKLLVIKRVRPHLANDKDFVAMFINEARLAALISHPNVVSILDLGQEGNDWFLAMEYLDGRDMLQVGRACRQQNKAVPFDVTARIVADTCAGLEHAHNLRGKDGQPLNLVHRDMSPENIIITFEGVVKVVDFGIAKARDNAFRTQAGQIKGKLGYVAPEAILGKTLDGRADIFALGATLYLFLCGRPAFSGANPMEIFEKSLQPPTAPRAINPRVPESLEAICMRCLDQDRDKRYRNAGELRAALEAHLTSSGRPLGAAQLSQFMKILFPPNSDPQRQRTEQLIADANRRPPAVAASSTKPAADNTAVTQSIRPFSGSMEAQAAPNAPVVDDERTAVGVDIPSHSATAESRATSGRGAPASVELPGAQSPVRTSPGFRSVELADEVDRKRPARTVTLPPGTPSQPPTPPPPTVPVMPAHLAEATMSIDIDDVLEESEEAAEPTLVGAARTSRAPTYGGSAVSSDLGLPPIIVDDDNQPTVASAPPSSSMPPPPSADALGITLQEVPPSGPGVDVEPPPPPGPFAPPSADDAAYMVVGAPSSAGAVVEKPAPLALRLLLLVLGLAVGFALVGAGVFAMGDLEPLLAFLRTLVPTS